MIIGCASGTRPICGNSEVLYGISNCHDIIHAKCQVERGDAWQLAVKWFMELNKGRMQN